MKHKDIIRLNHEWLDRVSEINWRYGTRTGGADSTLSVHLAINAAIFILQEDVGPHNAREWVEEQIARFESLALAANPKPKKGSPRRHKPRPIA